MGKLFISIGGGSGGSSDDVTAARSDVLKGTTTITRDSDDEIVEGTLELTGNTSAANVLSGNTFYTTDPKTKSTGTMIDLHTTNKTTTLTTSDPRVVIVGNSSWDVANADGTRRTCIQVGARGKVEANDIIAMPSATIAGNGGLTAAKLLKGQSAFGISGTATSDATATAAYIYSGKTAYVNGSKITGTMTVSSVVSFSAAAYSTSQILCTWKNPASGPYSGFIICAKTNSYPTAYNDSQIYKGAGTNSGLSAANSATISGLAPGTTYYFRIWTYCTCSAGEIRSSSYLQTTAAPTASGRQVFTSSATFTVPAAVRMINIHCTGGGAGGGSATNGTSYQNGGAGGGGGFTAYKTNIGVTPGTSIAVIVGAGGVGGGTNTTKPGGASSASMNGTILVSAAGGGTVSVTSGGSGGGWGGFSSSNDDGSASPYYGGNGGADGGNAVLKRGSYFPTASINKGIYCGQGTTTREMGSASGTLYAGGGGGGDSRSAYYDVSPGGSGGGGQGGITPTAGTAGSGGGGGGGGYSSAGANGGSGNVVITWT